MKKSGLVFRYRWIFILVPLLLTVLMAIPLKRAKINADLNAYLPNDMPSKRNMDALEKVFGKTDPIMLLFESEDVLNPSTLLRISHITGAFEDSSCFKDVISVFSMKYIRGEEGTMIVDPVIRNFPENETEREILRNEIRDNPLVYKLVVSEDFRYAAIILNPASGYPDDLLFRAIKNTLQEFPGPEQTWLNGMPYLRDEIQKKGIRDLALLIPLGLVVMILLLWLSFREVKGVFVPLSVVAMSIVAAMGLMPLIGYDLSLIAVLVPILMIAIANNYGVHIITRYQELNAKFPGRSMQTILEEALYYLRKPILLTALTTIAGILGMVTQIMLPAKQMGIVSAAGIGLALLLSLWYIPAVMAGLKKGKPNGGFLRKKLTLIDKFLGWAGNAVTLRPKIVIAGFLSFFILTGLGIARIRVSFNNEKIMPASHSLRIATKIANNHFGGTKIIFLLFGGDILDPAVMQTMDRFETELESLPQTGSVTSLATVVRTISRAMNDRGDPLYDAIPGQRDIIAQYIEFYNMSGDPSDFEKLVNFDYTRANLTVQFKAENITEFRKMEAAIDKLMQSSPNCRLKAGHCLVEKEMAESLVRGQNYSLIFALLAIIVLVGLIFRSLSAGLTGAIPLFYTLVCTFGLMGWAGLELDIATSLLSSVAIGLGVDYTIHLFWRLKTELSNGTEYRTAVRKTLRTTGRGIAINAFSVMIGFAVLFFSGLTILKAFGFLIIFSLLLCLLSALMLIPALCLMTNPRFLKNSPIQNFNKINGL